MDREYWKNIWNDVIMKYSSLKNESLFLITIFFEIDPIVYPITVSVYNLLDGQQFS